MRKELKELLCTLQKLLRKSWWLIKKCCSQT